MNIGHLIWTNPNLDLSFLVNFNKLLYLFSIFYYCKVYFILLKIVRVYLWTIFKKFMLNGPNEYSLILGLNAVLTFYFD
jgi:hypothetical protein